MFRYSHCKMLQVISNPNNLENFCFCKRASAIMMSRRLPQVASRQLLIFCHSPIPFSGIIPQLKFILPLNLVPTVWPPQHKESRFDEV